jgi:hypothetical protein
MKKNTAKATQAIENAERMIAWAHEHPAKAAQAFDNARQALDFAEDRTDSQPLRERAGRLRLQLPEWQREAAE